MAEVNLNKNVLRDILSKSENNNSIFNTYKDKKEIGKEIFKELYERFDKDGAKKGFYMDDSKEIGILSQCQSLQSLLLLSSEFGLNFDDKHIVSEEETNYTIREIMDFVIEDVIDRISTKNPSEYKFDASPYDTGKHFDVKYSNIEAMTWVVPSFLLALKYHATINETCKWQEKLVDVVTYCINYMNNSFIESEDEGKSKKLEIGWNFTADCEEPSLFYSFSVCECFVSFYETFRDYLEYHEAVRNQKIYGIAVDKKLEASYAKHQEAYNKALEKDAPGLNAEGRQIARFDEFNEVALRFKEINNGVEGIDETSLYGVFKENCKRIAREIWRLSKGQLADKFFYNDLETTLNEEDISMATTSDALFNTVYIINTMLDAGLDEDLQHQMHATTLGEGEVANAEAQERLEAEHEKAEREYNNLLEACQIASQKAFRTYEKLKSKGKEYIVEQFLVGFNESFTVHKDKVKELRKLRMRVFTLMPLLIRTNNVISEYLIKYPQANMKKYLGYILENRYKQGKKYKWIWENDGFFSCSNYYYVAALGEFYGYYEKYEMKYISDFATNEKNIASIKDDYLKELKAPGGKIAELDRELKERQEEVIDLKKKLANIETPVEDAVAGVVEKEMAKLLPKMMSNFILEAAKGLTSNNVDDTLKLESHEAFAEAMGEFFLAMMSDSIYEESMSKNKSKQENVERYNTLKKAIKEDVQRSIQYYVADSSNSAGKTGSLFYKSKTIE